MKKLFFFIIIAAACWSCSPSSANISGCISSPNTKVSIIQLGATTQVLLDTLHTDARGCFRYRLRLQQDEPMFLLLRTDSIQIATLLISRGEKINLEIGEGGQYTLTGSKGSLLLQELNNNFNTSVFRFDSLYRVLSNNEGAKDFAAIHERINRELGSVYVRQRRDAINFIFQHPTSFASIAAIFQRYPTGLQVFSAIGDTVFFKKLHDSLQTVYPKSDYLAALLDEIDRRQRADVKHDMVENISLVGFPDLELPDINAERIKLSSLQGNVVLVYFWASDNVAQRTHNNELRRLYDQFSPKGFDIYQVAVDVDKPAWARQVRAQNMPWINVCDGFGANSPAVRLYNVSQLPASFLIDKNGVLVATNLFGKELERKIAELCK